MDWSPSWTYNDISGFLPEMDTVAFTLASVPTGPVSINVTKDIKDWIANPSTNYGWAFNPFKVPFDITWLFSSSEYSLRPPELVLNVAASRKRFYCVTNQCSDINIGLFFKVSDAFDVGSFQGEDSNKI